MGIIKELRVHLITVSNYKDNRIQFTSKAYDLTILSHMGLIKILGKY